MNEHHRAFNSKLVVICFAAFGLLAISSVAAAVIISVLDQGKTTEVAQAAPERVPSVVYLSVSPGIAPGSDGQLHDAYSITNFNVHVGQSVKLVINNTDSSQHTITSPQAGVNIIVKPGKHIYALLVRQPGQFEWHCLVPCDPWAMQHVGYMRGYITATA